MYNRIAAYRRYRAVLQLPAIRMPEALTARWFGKRESDSGVQRQSRWW